MEPITLTKSRDISAYYRGSMIQWAIDVELRIDIVIGRFLSSNKQERVLDTIEIFDSAESIGFYAKNMAIQYIIKKHYPQFLKDNKGFLEDIDYLIKTRNIVAHKRPDISLNDYSVLGWAKTSKNSVGKNSYYINKETCAKYNNLAADTYAKIIELEGLVAPQNKDG
tara:strand:- start:633 stop:1133 length:501 start_codon:yes stop_codon:yes gene_type:complete